MSAMWLCLSNQVVNCYNFNNVSYQETTHDISIYVSLPLDAFNYVNAILCNDPYLCCIGNFSICGSRVLPKLVCTHPFIPHDMMYLPLMQASIAFYFTLLCVMHLYILHSLLKTYVVFSAFS